MTVKNLANLYQVTPQAIYSYAKSIGLDAGILTDKKTKQVSSEIQKMLDEHFLPKTNKQSSLLKSASGMNEVVELLRADNERQRAEIERLQSEVDKLNAKIEKLEEQNRADLLREQERADQRVNQANTLAALALQQNQKEPFFKRLFGKTEPKQETEQ